MSFVTVSFLLMLSGLSNGDSKLLGFLDEDSGGQLQMEREYDQLLRAENIGNWIQELSAKPHHVGSPRGQEIAEFIAGQFSSWGYETRVEEFLVLFPTPKLRQLEMVHPESFRATLQESARSSEESASIDHYLPPYNAYSRDGDVTAELVYVNYGVPSDYEELAKLGIDVEGKIVIARYGGSWRGIKPKVAADQGAVGCLLYSDPRDDGYFRGDSYPLGPFRNESGVQRGSVADMPIYPGDPLTPGEPAVQGANRLNPREAPTIARIPVLPISYGDALPLLRALTGPVAPERWRGSLPITYHIGPGSARVRLRVEFHWDLKPAFNVIAKLPGAERPEQWIIRGNHHDAWVYGAADPVSGLAAMMEEARAIGELTKTGWRPKRTVVYAAWDAEEPGLIGSTEWVELHKDELIEHAVVYINSDSNGRGFLSMGGSHSLEAFVNQVARAVKDPQREVSVWERRRAMLIARSAREASADLRSRVDLPLGALGSGSDYTPFLQHLGVASLNLSFGGENAGGAYHSNIDSFQHYSRFGDPDFAYGVALAQTAGRAVLRLSNATILPFQFNNSVNTIDTYIAEVEKLLETMRAETVEHNLRVEEGIDFLASDPRKPFVAPRSKSVVPHVSFAPLKNALQDLKIKASLFDRSVESLSASGKRLPQGVLAEVDKVLQGAERTLTREEGLPNRAWFKHFIYAPGFYTGYGVKTLPAVREAIEQRAWEQAEKGIQVTAEALRSYSSTIGRAIEVMTR